MKKSLNLVVIICLTTYSYGQRTEVEIFKAHFNQEKTDLVASFMDLTNEEEPIFWPIYRAYEGERGKTADKRIESLHQYLNFNETLTNDQASYWYGEYLLQDKADNKIKRKYYKKFSKSLTPLVALRFFQLEEFLDSAIKTKVLESLPALENY